MDKLFKNFLRWGQEYRTRKFSRVGKFFLKIGISANLMTTISLVFGLLAVYFLFSNHFLFALFVLLHLIADALDGVIARVSIPSKFGEYYDHIGDGLITLLALIKIGWFTQEYFVYIISGLFSLAQGIYFLSKCKAPVLFTRTITLLLLVLYLPAVIPLTSSLISITYLANGVVAVYSLARQLQYYRMSRRMV
ncbi:CDP-alcohol phosphatidyltransferase family protein [Candidatus Woesearchaeota archaeon]|nr:CDP-alcohol phosphatidyltransferase family protein [Candidatus Woesearchaeota archaeon]